MVIERNHKYTNTKAFAKDLFLTTSERVLRMSLLVARFRASVCLFYLMSLVRTDTTLDLS